MSLDFEPYQQISRWLAMADVATAKRSIAPAVKQRVLGCKCLVCENPANSSRGLCVAHYLQFHRALMSLPKAKRAEFELEQVREGRILASGQFRKIKNPSPFQTGND
jgi:hypothetical protein